MHLWIELLSFLEQRGQIVGYMRARMQKIGNTHDLRGALLHTKGDGLRNGGAIALQKTDLHNREDTASFYFINHAIHRLVSGRAWAAVNQHQQSLFSHAPLLLRL